MILLVAVGELEFEETTDMCVWVWGGGDGWLLEFYILATYKVTSGCVLTYNSAHSW